MSESKREQLRDLERARRQWEDDPDNRAPYPLIGLIEELGGKTVGRETPPSDEPDPADDSPV